MCICMYVKYVTHMQNSRILREVPFYVVAVVVLFNGQHVLASNVWGDGHLKGDKEIKRLMN
jgi:hypothetical protein